MLRYDVIQSGFRSHYTSSCAVGVLALILDIKGGVESEIKYRPTSIIGRICKIYVSLGQLLLAPKCSSKSQTLVNTAEMALR